MKGYKKLALLTLTAGSILLTSTGQAADLTAESAFPIITFNDTDAILGPAWILTGTEEADGSGVFVLEDLMGNQKHPVIDIRGIGGSNNNENSLVVYSSGDISLANDSVFIDRSEGAMGIGTATPGAGFPNYPLNNPQLHIKDTTGFSGIIQENNNSTWLRNNGSDGAYTNRLAPNPVEGVFRLYNTAPANSITATDVGVGIGTNTPAAKLDVDGNINATFDGIGSKNLQTLFVMSANNTDSGKKSDVGFVVKNTRENFSYAFRTLEKFTRPGETSEIDGGFAISKQATGAQELVLINPTTNDPTKVELHLSSGASNVAGQWENASSRSYKKNIHELSGEDAMQAMRGLTSVTYQFKQDKGNNKMIGFIAEDIPELLATKTRKTVDPLRIVAVLTKAVQEQDKELFETKATIKAKDKRITDMEAKAAKNTSRLEKLEAQLDKLMQK